MGKITQDNGRSFIPGSDMLEVLLVGDAAQVQNLRPDLSIADAAYQILKQRREPMKYRDLIQEVLALRGVQPGPGLAKVMAKAHTEISLDNRFLNQGNGMCGLREWSIKAPIYKVIELSPAERPKPGERLRRELELIDEEYQTEEIVEEEQMGEPEEPEEG